MVSGPLLGARAGRTFLNFGQQVMLTPGEFARIGWFVSRNGAESRVSKSRNGASFEVLMVENMV